MAISWGAWEGASPNRIRVGIDVSWEAISHSETAATATIKIYTDVEGNWSDTQTLSFGGSIGGSITFSNNQDNNSVLRETKSYTYNYGSGSYGSSPGDRTFTASLSGAFNGATPSKSVTSNIPARPYGTPAAPTNVDVSRVSSTSAKVTWTNKDTAGEPWSTVRIQVDGAANDVWNGDAGTTGGSGTSFTDSGLSANALYKWRVRAENSVGDSSWVETGVYYTDPSAPTIGANNPGTGSQRVISWTDGANSSMSYVTEVWVSRDDGATWSLLNGSVPKGTTSYTDTAASAAQKTGYKVRHKTTAGQQGTVYSAFSANSTFTVGVTSAPNAPTNLSPANNNITIPTQTKTFTWQHNSTDTTPQSAYQIQYRVVGAGSWTTLSKVSSSVSSYTAAANFFADNTSFEWQVRTWGTLATGGADGTGASAWSASATFKTVGDPNNARRMKRLMRLDLESGQVETAPEGSLTPIGSVVMYGGGAAPAGWLLCHGQSLLRADYPDLFGVIGTAYGSVDATHFTLPDMRLKFPRGGSTETSKTVGGSTTITAGNLPPHAHDMTHDHDNLTVNLQYATTTSTGGTATRVTDIANKTGGAGTSVAIDANWIATWSGNTGNGPGTNAAYWQPYVDFNFIIKV